MPLSRIVYVSDAVGAAADGLMPLIDIVGASDRNNRRDHLTGVLMRCEGRFLQVIEGTRADLDRLMKRLDETPATPASASSATSRSRPGCFPTGAWRGSIRRRKSPRFWTRRRTP